MKRRGKMRDGSSDDSARARALRVAAVVRERVRELQDALEQLDATADACANAALDAERERAGASSELRVRVERLCALRREKLAGMDALKALEREYEEDDASARASFDFDGYLDRNTKSYVASRAKELDYLIAFDAAVKKASMGGMDADADLVMEDDGGDGPRNAKCPLTMKPVEEMEDPVEDARGFVYEREAIVQYIGKSKSTACPVAGTNHKVTVSELKPSRAAKKFKQRAAGLGDAYAGTLISP